MKRLFIFAISLVLVSGLVLSGCGTPKAESGKDAIETAKAMETVKEKTEYLIGQAQAFYDSKEFQDAVDVAQYVLRYLDRDSQAAKDLLQKAKDELAAQAKAAAGEARKNFGF